MSLRESLMVCVLMFALCCSNPSSETSGGEPDTVAESQPPASLAPDDAEESGGMLLDEGVNSDFGAVLSRISDPFTGDLGEMRQRRVIRVLVSYSKSNYFYHKGYARGFEVELLRKLEVFLNPKTRLEDRVRIAFVPTPVNRHLSDLQQGKGDLVAAGLTITPERLEQVDFTDPYLSDVREVVVAHHSLSGLESTNDLAGRRVFVTAGSSYLEHLNGLNRDFVAAGLPAMQIVEAAPELVIEDLLEMVHAGVLTLTVADGHIANAWAQVLSEIRVRSDLVIHGGGAIGWAVRRQNPDLRAALNSFVRQNRKGTLLGNMLFKRYFAGSKWIGNPISRTERVKLDEGAALFRRYAAQYDLDWLALAAQAYQESGLDQGKESPVGAIGVMQLLPSTAADPSIDIPDITTLENNIHAGAKYLAFLRDRYFSGPELDPKARIDFSWAAYNAGPARIRRLRRKAEARGFDPNRWFNNVEKIAAEEIGRETVDYVANVNKYYLAYRLGFEADRRRQAARENVGGE